MTAQTSAHDPVGSLDSPRHGAHVDQDLMVVQGWALFPAARTARVNIVVNGECVGHARLHTPRLDVSEADMRPDAPVAGFVFHLPTAELPSDRFDVRAVVTADDGAELLVGPAECTRVQAKVPPEDRSTIVRDENRTRELLQSLPKPDHLGSGVRLLASAHHLGRGGAQLFLRDLLIGLKRQGGVEVEVVTFNDGPLRQDLEREGIPVHVTRAPATSTVSEYEGQVRELALLLRASGANVVLANTLLSFPLVDAAQRAGLPVVWSIHESYRLEHFAEQFLPATPPRPVMEAWRRTLRESAALVFAAEATLELYSWAGPEDRHVVIPYGLPASRVGDNQRRAAREAIRTRIAAGENDRVLLCLGIFEERKGQASLIGAMPSLLALHPGTMLLCVGDIGDDYSQATREFAQRLDLLGTRVHLLPVTDDPTSLYAAADLLVCPSDIESLPLVVLEAMAHGLPVVASDAFGLAELITDGRTGWLHPPRDLRALIATLSTTLGLDEQHWDDVAVAAKALVRERHNRGAALATYNTLLARLATDSAASPKAIMSGPAA